MHSPRKSNMVGHMVQDFLLQGLTIRVFGEKGCKIMYDLEATPIPTVERKNEITNIWFDEQFVLAPVSEVVKPSNLLLNLLKRI